MRVMLVDDDQMIVRGLAGILSRMELDGLKLTSAYNALDALEILKHQGADLLITDVEINYDLGLDDAKERSSYISSFHLTPNPASTYINIETNQLEPYHIAIYDMTGRVIFAQEGFTDGALNVAHLKAGNYLVVASTKQHRAAKKLLIQN